MTDTLMQDQGASPNTGTGAGLIAFLNYLIKKNEMATATASALRTGCQKVLGVEDDPDALDIRTADVDNIIARFRNKHRGDMKDKTLDVYEQRFRQSVDMYRKWLNDEDWRPSQQRRTRTNGVSGGSAAAAKKRERVSREEPNPPGGGGRQETGMIAYPFPIRPGVHGKITLPEDLSPREAQRISAFVATLAFDDVPEPLQITTGYNEE